MNRDIGRHTWRLWILVALGPAAWFADLSLSYAVGPPAHRAVNLGLVRGIHVVALTVALVAFAISLGELWALGIRRSAKDPAEALDARTGRQHLLLIAALAFSLLGTVLIAANLTASLLLSGQEP